LAGEEENFKKEVADAPLKHPVPFYLSGLVLVERYLKGKKKRLLLNINYHI